MIGSRFSRLVIIEELPRKFYKTTSSRAYLCKCDCGNFIETTPSNLKRGSTKSCGCLKKETAGTIRKTHGMSNTSEYKIWAGIIKRCTNSKYKEFHLYGGRGISVCDRWLKFENFFLDMGERPTKSHSIDRVDPNGNYCKENCQWATDIQQGLNQRKTNSISVDGNRLSLRQFAKKIGISYYTLYDLVIRKNISVPLLINKISYLSASSWQPMYPDSLLIHKSSQL